MPDLTGAPKGASHRPDGAAPQTQAGADPAAPVISVIPGGAVLGARKSAGPTLFIVKHDILGTHARADMPDIQPKLKGDQVSREELGPGCDVERLIALGAIEPLILV